jgi:hypothetical protein
VTAPRPRTILLALTSGSLSILLAFLWNNGQRSVHEPQNLPVHTLAAPDLTILSAPTPPSINVAAIRDQAVFHSRRSFYQPPLPLQIIPTPDYDLAGTMDLPQGKRIAFVKKKSDQSSRTLHIGDDLDGWHVQLIESSRVVVVRDEQTAELKGTDSPSSNGLVRGPAGPRVAQTGLRMPDAQGHAHSIAAKTAPIGARTYQPPPH